MDPYTSSGLERQESSDSGATRRHASNDTEITYELVGVVVHSGQANAGHYYSFIKDRRWVKRYLKLGTLY